MKNYSLLIIAIMLVSLQGCSSGQGSPDKRSVLDTIPQVSTETTTPPNKSPNGIIDFVSASRAVTPSVVHIKTIYTASRTNRNAAGQIDGSSARGSAVMGSASGIIIEADGYIATNNHVVENAAEIKVILPDKRVFTATLIGRDPNTDLALLKINATGLPVIKFGNSDIVQVGEWVLAVGYPFSLNTTVTAGIVSAKARSIGIINDPGSTNADGNAQNRSSAVESFIQTDAAINPGNSGGALVNTTGELIGINSAIASQTGSYAGYAFAIPVNLAKKILDDLKKYGSVKRGVLGVSFPAPAVEDQFFKQQGLNPATVKGVYITSVLSQSAAAAAGLIEGDIIKSIDGVQLTSSTEFSERIARHKPGDVIKLVYSRQGTALTASVTLKGDESAKIAANLNESLKNIYNKLGAGFASLTREQKQQLNLNTGIVVTDVRSGGFFDEIGIPIYTIIVYINGKPVNTPKDIDQALLSAQNGVIQMLAIAPDGSRVVFNFSLGT
jgi:serine protease Do